MSKELGTLFGTTRDGARVRELALVLLQGVVAQHHVHRTLPAGDGQRPEGRPEGDDAAGQQINRL